MVCSITNWTSPLLAEGHCHTKVGQREVEICFSDILLREKVIAVTLIDFQVQGGEAAIRLCQVPSWLSASQVAYAVVVPPRGNLRLE